MRLTTRSLSSLLSVLVAIAARPSSSSAAGPDDLHQEVVDQLDAHKLPQMPATFVLGSETNEVQRPGSMSEIGAALLNAINTDGTIKTGVAVEFAPLRLLLAKRHTAEDWASGKVSWGEGIPDSLAVSFATAEGTKDPMGVSGPARSALGVRLDLLDTADLRRSDAYYTCVRKALVALQEKILENHKPHPEADGPVVVTTDSAATAAAAVAIETCADVRSGWVVELAGAITTAGDLDSASVAGKRAWLSTSYASGALTLVLQGDVDRRSEDRDRTDLFVGGRLDYTRTDGKVTAGIEAFYAGTDLNVDADKQSKMGFGLSIDLKLGYGLALSAGVQGRTDFDDDFNLIVLTKVSFLFDGKYNDLFSHTFQPL